MLCFPDYHLERGEGDLSQVCPSFLEGEEGARVRNFPSGRRQNRKSRKIRCILIKQENYLGGKQEGNGGSRLDKNNTLSGRLRENNTLARK